MEENILSAENSIMNVASVPTVSTDIVSSETLDTNDAINNAAISAGINPQMFTMPPRVKTRVKDYPNLGRNDECPCGSGKKYKHCCLESGKYETYTELD